MIAYLFALYVSLFAQTTTVHMVKGNRFDQPEVHIKVGDAVKWINTDNMLHSATAKVKDGKIPFNSGMLTKDKSYSHTFLEAGTYEYYCIPHQNMGMRGTVVVE